MDEADYAKIHEQQARDRALARALAREDTPAQQRDDQGRIICIDCGAPIPLARLAVRPEAVRCIDCKSAHERRAGR